MPRSGMNKKTARMILVMVAGLWIVTVWALSVGAVEPDDPQVMRTHCFLTVGGEEVCDPEGEEHSASPSGSASPSRSATPSRSPSPSRSATPSGSGSPPGSSPSPTPSQTRSTPPPPSIRTYDSRITIKGSFKGKVTSENARCEPRRKVTLKKVKRGKDATVGGDRTNARGGWSINKNVNKGRYYAKVSRKQFQGNGNTTIRCNAARSRTIRP